MNSVDRTADIPQLQPDTQHTPREWVTPTLERLALKDALNDVTGGDDDLAFSATS